MELSKTLEQALNNQIGMEYEASIKYDSIGSYFTNEELPMLAKFFFQQATEERQHAHKFIKYLLDRDGQLRIPAIAAPTFKFGSAVEAVKHALDGEMKVTKSIHDLYDLATKERDHATSIMLHWFITEQVEEEQRVRQMLRTVERGKESGMLTVEDYLAEFSEGGAAEDHKK